MSNNFGHVTHHFVKDPQNGAFRVGKVTPIIRLSCQSGTLFLQQGRVLDEGGNVVTDPPGWFYEEVAKVSAQALIESGFKSRPREVDMKAAAAAAKAAADKRAQEAAIRKAELAAQEPNEADLATFDDPPAMTEFDRIEALHKQSDAEIEVALSAPIETPIGKKSKG